jgi:hypothetical protein
MDLKRERTLISLFQSKKVGRASTYERVQLHVDEAGNYKNILYCS